MSKIFLSVNSLLIFMIALGLFLFWILMIIDCLKRPFKRPQERVIWFFALVFFQAMGAFVYWLVVQRKT